MYSVGLFFCAIFGVVLCFSSVPKVNCQGSDWRRGDIACNNCLQAYSNSKRSAPVRRLYVDWRRGAFRTIQSAIDHIPSDNRVWTRIYVKAGTYREQIHIPRDKPYIYIQGEGKRKTGVVFNRDGKIDKSPTLISEADNIVFKSITFMHSHNYPLSSNKKSIIAAPAASISGDKCAFYRCAFLGVQDTLWDAAGRHYFKSCTIQGAVDFIFGAGQSIYEGCSISVVAGALNGAGYITAQGRNTSLESSGFVFKNCNIFGNGMTYLGRPWRPFARVIFYNTSMSNIIVPKGWAAWQSRGHEETLSLGEHSCRGPGANRAGRVPWQYKFNSATVNAFTSIKYIDSEGWIQKQAFNLN